MDWGPIYATNDVNMAYGMFLEQLKALYNNKIPLKSRKSNKVPKKTWITNDLLKSIKIKYKMYKSMKINGNHTMFEEYKKYRNQ